MEYYAASLPRSLSSSGGRMSTGKPIGNNPIFQQTHIQPRQPQEGASPVEPTDEVKAEEEEQTGSISESVPNE
jgi:hypothetical protein